MAVDVEELIILPFREVVERGKEATTNAEEAQNEDPEQAKQMMKFATMITKEGERALKRLQPLWDNQVEKHGDMFKEIIADNVRRGTSRDQIVRPGRFGLHQENEDRNQDSDNPGPRVSAVASLTAVTNTVSEA
ncbi:SH3 domain-containing protein [Colletotrichum tofieldiae]|nr:SH3 domain-containing protein [Colletotrichum tofieldiae]